MFFSSINGGWHSSLPYGSWQLFVQLCSGNIFEHLCSCVFDKRWCRGFVMFKSMNLLWKKIFCTALKWCNYSNFQQSEFFSTLCLSQEKANASVHFFYFCICKIWGIVLRISGLEHSFKYIYMYLYSLQHLCIVNPSTILTFMRLLMSVLGCCCCCSWVLVCGFFLHLTGSSPIRETSLPA